MSLLTSLRELGSQKTTKGKNAVANANRPRNGTNGATNGAYETPRSPRQMACFKLFLIALIVVQLGIIIGMHAGRNLGSAFPSHSQVIYDHLLGFHGGQSRAVTMSKRITAFDNADTTLLYSKWEEESGNLWDNSTTIPQWMKNYLKWHREQMSDLTKDNWMKKRFLVMQCLEEDEHCGGTADRLKPLPAMTLLANYSKRILLIRWERPCKLEHFLLPPQGGVDWRIPEWLEPQLPRRPYASGFPIGERLAESDSPVAMTRYQSYNAGAPWFDERTNETTFVGVYHDLWKVFFTPVPPIAAMIQHSMKTMGLNPGQYAAAHLRALYGIKFRPLDDIQKMAINAVSCASRLNPGSPIYFAADSKEAVLFTQQYAVANKRKIVTLSDDDSPLHLEKTADWRDRHPSEFFSTFRDLYLIGFSNCVSYNVGGFGNWGLMLSGNASCGMRYVTGDPRHSLIGCDWTDGETTPSYAYKPVKFEQPIGIALKKNKNETKALKLFSNRTKSATLPSWLEEYFQWHAIEREQLTEKNWRSKKFLIMVCTLEDDKCGGTADRLKPLPAILFLANRTKRILLIYWDKPCRLEEFLVPPPGGLNWTLPSFMENKLKDEKKLVDLRRIDRVLDTFDDAIVRLRVQSNAGGATYYEGWTNTTHDSFYHEMFHSMFTPSPPLAEAISKNMHQLGLKPGEYAAAHLRATYARNSRPRKETAELAINAVKCASRLRPGGPIYFASDSKYAVEVIQKYAKEKSRPIVGLIHEDEPLHIDRALNATSRHPSEYYSIFVDLYLLGESRCLSYNIGGFGTWGLLLGYNSSCGIAHVGTDYAMRRCEWVDVSPP